ncbi:AraC family transcriptional regulator [Actinoplanes sp. NPDC051633]|uniref:AraC family transcriptional regulator n=1 Tax=Actinoplanes sp. NPDC051633 TaxID=3155670 RepID=UPI003426A3F1
MDLLSAVFREVHFESAGYRWLEMRAPWRIDFDRPELRGVHIIAKGSCEIEFADGSVEELDAGDLVILPRGDMHALRSPGARQMRGVSERRVADDAGSHRHPEPHTVVVCGAFLVGEPDHPALRGLPRAVRVAGENGRPAPWLGPLIEAISAEAHDGGPGSDLVMARLSDAMLLRALRARASTMDHPGWLAGIADPYVAVALEAMHGDLGRQWTLAGLAAAAGLSRAAFAARFSERVGEPAMSYLLALRMQRAKVLLADGETTVAAAARSVGYQSEVGFAAAFKRETGVPPGRYRKMRKHDR